MQLTGCLSLNAMGEFCSLLPFLVSFSESDFPPGLFFSSFDADNESGEVGAPGGLDCAELKFF